MVLNDKIYITLCAVFSILTVLGNLTYQKFVSLPLGPFYTFNLSVGALLYPFTFLIMDLLTELFGKDKAIFCIKLAIGMDVFAMAIIMGMDQLNATSWSFLTNDLFHSVFGFYGIAFTGSIIALYVAQKIDVLLYLQIRHWTKGRFLWLRSSGSTAISLLVDTMIVVSVLTLFDVLPEKEFMTLIKGSYGFKLLCTVLNIPLFYGFVRLYKAKFHRR